MLNGVNLRIKLNRAKNVCCPVSSAAGVNFKVAITEAILFVRTVKVASSTILGHATALNTPAPSIPSAESIVKCSLLQEDLVVYPWQHLSGSYSQADTEAYNGSYRTNPFYFKHHNLTQVGAVFVDGEQIPREPLFLNFHAAGGQNVMACYQSLFSGTGKFSQDTGNQINRSDYGSGYTLFAFDLTPHHCPGDHFELI